jgi:hypothetical protein
LRESTKTKKGYSSQVIESNRKEDKGRTLISFVFNTARYNCSDKVERKRGSPIPNKAEGLQINGNRGRRNEGN